MSEQIVTDATAVKENLPAEAVKEASKERKPRNQRRPRKDSDAKPSAKADAKAEPKGDAEAKPARKPREVAPNDSNVLLFGKKRTALSYMSLCKSLLNLGKHETLELHGIGEVGNIKVAQVSNSLQKWGYVKMTRIGTCHTAGHSLQVTIAKSADFQKLYDAFEAERLERKEKYLAEKEAAKAAAAAAKEAANQAKEAERTDGVKAEAEAAVAAE